MIIRNKKIVTLITLVTGIAILLFWGNILFKMVSLPFTGKTAEATVTGYKISANGARKVQHATSVAKPLSGRSPFFEFTDAGKAISTYSNAPQLFVLFNYELGEKITVAYPENEPQKAVIINWKELPGIIFMLLFGLLMLAVSYSDKLKKSNQ
ncbi:DUF3592 domain-containing protein [Flavobacterium sp.]|uniref:DUF3592 domain-containing protein n=1 Tax=Flavobacterium sp. TaxID=239 RepID=UPI0026296814|nr:DUF3592 domain-containing protein [Flavobacterium sp.]